MKSKKNSNTNEQPDEQQIKATELFSKFEKNLDSLYYKYRQYLSSKKEKKKPTLRNSFNIYIMWLEHYLLYHDNKKFKGEALKYKYESYLSGPTLYDFFNALNPYAELKLTWNFRFDHSFINRLKSYPNEQRRIIMTEVFNLATGDFHKAPLQSVGPLNFMGTFALNLHHNNWILVFCILPERRPNLVKNQVTSYTYSQYIRFLEIVTDPRQIRVIVDRYFKKIADHPDKFKCFESGEYLDQLPFSSTATLHGSSDKDLSAVISVNFLKGIFIDS